MFLPKTKPMHVYSLSETPEVDTLCSQPIKLTPLRFMYVMNHEITVYFVLFMALLEYQDSTSLYASLMYRYNSNPLA